MACQHSAPGALSDADASVGVAAKRRPAQEFSMQYFGLSGPQETAKARYLAATKKKSSLPGSEP